MIKRIRGTQFQFCIAGFDNSDHRRSWKRPEPVKEADAVATHQQTQWNGLFVVAIMLEENLLEREVSKLNDSCFDQRNFPDILPLKQHKATETETSINEGDWKGMDQSRHLTSVGWWNGAKWSNQKQQM